MFAKALCIIFACLAGLSCGKSRCEKVVEFCETNCAKSESTFNPTICVTADNCEDQFSKCSGDSKSRAEDLFDCMVEYQCPKIKGYENCCDQAFAACSQESAGDIACSVDVYKDSFNSK